MSISVELPSLGESVVEGTISRWLVSVGDQVQTDQPLVEVTTDKVDAEIPSPAAGVVTALRAEEGEVVEVGAVLAEIDTEAKSAEEAPGAVAMEEVPVAAPASQPPPRSASAASEESTESPRATPVARRMAAEANLELDGIAGSGSGGRRGMPKGWSSTPRRAIWERPSRPRTAAIWWAATTRPSPSWSRLSGTSGRRARSGSGWTARFSRA